MIIEKYKTFSIENHLQDQIEKKKNKRPKNIIWQYIFFHFFF